MTHKFNMTDKLDDAQQETLERLVKSGFIEGFKKVYGRSFILQASKTADGVLHLHAEDKDSGSEYMTVHDLAALLQTDVKSVRRMTEARAQRQAKYPIPFFKLHGKMLRFDRKKIQQWLHDIANMTPTFRLPKQQKRGRKPKVQ